MKIGIIADDFTGASDIALTVAEAGMSVAQFIGVPTRDVADVDAGVVALKSRTAPVAEAVEQSLAACDWLLSQGAEQIIFKVCSTFDSTPAGNIGPVMDALMDRLGETTAIICPAFPENGRSVYMGHLFVNDGLLNESGMQDHPLTPMTDPDIRRVMASQTEVAVGHVPFLTVQQGADAITAALAGTTGYAIVDAIRDADLLTIGAAAKGRKLLCGGSGIALGLPANFGHATAAPNWQGITGPGVVLSGSCSRATRGQVAEYKAHAPSRELTADAVMAGVDFDELVAWVLAQDVPPLVYSSSDPAVVRAAQDKYGQDTVAHAIEDLFSRLSGALKSAGVRRIVVAGGETSGAVVNGTGADVLHIGPRLAAGVPVCRIDGDVPVALALKSGNFGGPTFFADALALMETAQ